MTGTTHKIGGLTFGLLFMSLNLYLPSMPFVLFSIFTPVFLIGCILGALIPDIDSPKSTISRMLWFVAWPIWLVQSIIRKIFKNKKSEFAKNVCRTVGHRGIAHWLSLSLLYLLIIIAIAKLKMFIGYFSFEIVFEICIYFLYGTGVGYLSHIVLDEFNVTALPLLAPLSFKRTKTIFSVVTTGKHKRKKDLFTTSTSENIFIIILLIINLSLLYYLISGI